MEKPVTSVKLTADNGTVSSKKFFENSITLSPLTGL
jgi:hypothetical protein